MMRRVEDRWFAGLLGWKIGGGKQKIIDLVKREEQQTVRWQMKVKNIFMIFKAACLQSQ